MELIWVLTLNLGPPLHWEVLPVAISVILQRTLMPQSLTVLEFILLALFLPEPSLLIMACTLRIKSVEILLTSQFIQLEVKINLAGALEVDGTLQADWDIRW